MEKMMTQQVGILVCVLVRFTQSILHIGLLRLGMVESLSTPVAVDVEDRISFNGETIFDYEDQDTPASQPAVRPGLSRLVADLSPDTERPDNTVTRRDMSPIGLASQRPLTQVTRSSYMTTSDLSRMSGLSDFPVPPKSIYSERPESSLPPVTPGGFSAFDAYFEDESTHEGTPQPNASFSRPEYLDRSRTGPTTLSHDLQAQGGRVEFGVNLSALELAKSLSTPGLM
jgi:serine/arginine repetitive matrix protein 2